MNIYIPMTLNILTPGHIKVLETLRDMGNVRIGLLTSKALKGYKQELMPFEDRRFVAETIAIPLGIDVVAQESLDPTANLKKYKEEALASGDGFEDSELLAIKKLKLVKVHVKLKGEKFKKYSSSKIWKIKK